MVTIDWWLSAPEIQRLAVIEAIKLLNEARQSDED